jgi:subtilisin family serine protease
MALNAFGSETSTGEIYLISAIDYAVANGAHIINASWGIGDYPAAMAESIRRAVDAGVMFACSAGNNKMSLDLTPQYPAAFLYPRMVAVGGFEQEDLRYRNSSYGHSRVHILAPGRQILSTWSGGILRSASGTSLSAPHVCGLAALLISTRPEFIGGERGPARLRPGGAPDLDAPGIHRRRARPRRRLGVGQDHGRHGAAAAL